MPDEKNPTKKLYNENRRRAEDNLLDPLQMPENLSEIEVRSLLHELHVHQIELNLQNSELLSYQSRLEIERDRVTDLWDFAPVGYLTLRDDGIVVEANLTAAAMLEVERGNLIGQSLGRFITSPDGDTYFRFFRELFRNPHSHTVELRLVRQISGVFYAQLDAVLNTHLSNAVKTARISFSNIDQQKTAEHELAVTQANLEAQVVLRTSELEEANRQLKDEISRRTRVGEKLHAALAEKDVLLREVHHRVRNNMQAIMAMLAMKSGRGNAETDLFLLELEEQVRTMLLVYNQLFLSHDLARINMAPYIEQLTTNIFHAFGNGREIALKQAVSQVMLNIEEATPCGLIINELVTNALKYAFPPDLERPAEIEIILQEIGNRIHLTISDNGVGLPEGFDWRTSTSMGLHMVGLWATYQLAGRFDISKAEGTCYTVVFEHQKT